MRTIAVTTLAAAFFTLPSYATLTLCGTGTVEALAVQGSRDDNYAHEDKVTVTFADNGSPMSCSGTTNFYIENTHASYASMLSILLAAKAIGSEVHVYINSSTSIGSGAGLAYQLAIVALD
jgi:hypothetical protein